MTSPTFAVKDTAKTILKGNYYRCILATLIPVFLSLTVTFTASIMSVVLSNAVSYGLMAVMHVLVVLPVILGLLRFYHRLMWNQKDNVISVFHYYSDATLYKKALKYSFIFILRLLSVAVLTYLPVILLWIVSNEQIYEFLETEMPKFVSSLSVAEKGLTILSTATFIFFNLKYYLTPFLVVADEDMDISEALHMSKMISRKSTIDFVGLFFGMSFWILISVFSIPLPFTLPYIILAYMVHCRFAVAHYNETANRENAPPFYSSNI